MKILVTGGAGFIGSNLVNQLLSDSSDHFIVSLDNYTTGHKENLNSSRNHSNFLEVEHDVTYPLLEGHGKSQKWQKMSYNQIYHLACPASPIYYQKDPIQTIKTCIWGMINVIEFALAKKARIVFSSTSEVYGNPNEHPQKESYYGNVNPTSIRACYDEGKRAAETLCFDYQRQKQLNVGVVRIFNTYGKNMFPQDGRVVSNFIIQCLQDKDITIYGDGSQTRSFCHVNDMVAGLIAMMESSINGPINLGNPIEKTVEELAEIIIELTKSSSKIVYLPLPSDDPVKRRPDISQAKKYLNWKPKVDLEKGIIETIQYFKEQI